MRRALMILGLLLLIPATAHAGGGGGGGACPGFAEGTDISMLDSCFDGTHFAPTGQTLTVRNEGQIPHTYTAVDGSFDSGNLQPGETFELTLDEPGAIRVFCSLHGTAQGAGMAGVLLVGESSAVATGTPVALASNPVLPVARAAESSSMETWVPLTSGIAAGLAAAALFVATLGRRESQGITSPGGGA